MKRKRIILKTRLILIAAFTIITIYSSGQKDAAGIRLLELNQLGKAKSFFLKAVQSDPNNINHIFYMGETYFKLGMIDSAEYYYNSGIKIKTESALNYIGAGMILQEKGKPDEAKKMFTKAESYSNYKDANIYVKLAQACTNGSNKNFELADYYLQSAKKLKKTLASIYITTGNIFEMKNNLGDAATEYERAIYYDNKCTEAHYHLGVIYSKAQNFTASTNSFNTVIANDSNYFLVYRELGELYYNYGYYAKASENYGRYIRLSDPDFNDNIRYATILFFNKEYNKSQELLSQIVKSDSTNPVILRLNAYNLFEMKDYTNGLKAMYKFFEITPSARIIAQDMEYMGKMLSKNSQDSLAIVYYNNALQMDSTKKSLYEFIGNSYDRLKKFNFSADYYSKLLKVKKNVLSSDYFQYGRACYNAGNLFTEVADSLTKKSFYMESDTAFGTVISLSPASYIGYFWRARVKAMLDPESEIGLAKPFYEKVISITEPTPDKYKRELIEAYKYMGYYYFLQKDKDVSKEFWNKVLAIDPADATALEALKGIK